VTDIPKKRLAETAVTTDSPYRLAEVIALFHRGQLSRDGHALLLVLLGEHTADQLERLRAALDHQRERSQLHLHRLETTLAAADAFLHDGGMDAPRLILEADNIPLDSVDARAAEFRAQRQERAAAGRSGSQLPTAGSSPAPGQPPPAAAARASPTIYTTPAGKRPPALESRSGIP
jgi:hypothetical protein